MTYRDAMLSLARHRPVLRWLASTWLGLGIMSIATGWISYQAVLAILDETLIMAVVLVVEAMWWWAIYDLNRFLHGKR